MRLLQALLLLALAAAAAATPRRLRQAAAPAPEREATAFAVNYGRSGAVLSCSYQRCCSAPHRRRTATAPRAGCRLLHLGHR